MRNYGRAEEPPPNACRRSRTFSDLNPRKTPP